MRSSGRATKKQVRQQELTQASENYWPLIIVGLGGDVPSLDEPLVHGGGAGGGIGGVFQAGDELGQLVADLLLGFASHLVAAVLPSDRLADVGVFFHCSNLPSWDVRISYNRGELSSFGELWGEQK